MFRANYMYRDEISTEIVADFDKRKVEIKNHTDNLLKRAFGINETPTFDNFLEFLEDRCFPRTRDKLYIHLDELGIDSYDPLQIVIRTKGRVEGDFMWLDILEVPDEQL